jgi:hypothetical protein
MHTRATGWKYPVNHLSLYPEPPDGLCPDLNVGYRSHTETWQEPKMRYHNGVLRNDQDCTLRLKRYTQKQKLSWVEYLPAFVLGVLMMGLLMGSVLFF